MSSFVKNNYLEDIIEGLKEIKVSLTQEKENLEKSMDDLWAELGRTRAKRDFAEMLKLKNSTTYKENYEKRNDEFIQYQDNFFKEKDKLEKQYNMNSYELNEVNKLIKRNEKELEKIKSKK